MLFNGFIRFVYGNVDDDVGGNVYVVSSGCGSASVGNINYVVS